jgi:hypothetical protein
VTGLDTRLLAKRDTIRAVLGKNWRQAAVLTARPASVVSSGRVLGGRMLPVMGGRVTGLVC